jgi:hypothetical protein
MSSSIFMLIVNFLDYDLGRFSQCQYMVVSTPAIGL